MISLLAADGAMFSNAAAIAMRARRPTPGFLDVVDGNAAILAYLATSPCPQGSRSRRGRPAHRVIGGLMW